MSNPRRSDLLERRFADLVFYLLLATAVVLAGWLGAHHDRYWDWTASGRNTLSAESAAVIARVKGPLRITVFLDRSQPLAKRIEQLLARYRKAGADLTVSYVDPQLFPEQARAAQVTALGQIQIEYRGRRETLRQIGEAPLTAAIARLTRNDVPWVAVLEGHGERRIDGAGGTDLGRFAELVRARGIRVQPLDLVSDPAVPANTRLLVVSTASIALFPGEAKAVIRYLDQGGNLLWLMDPGRLDGLEPVAEHLGVERLPGELVDANVRELNIDDPTVALVKNFPDHPLTGGLSAPALFPGTVAFLPHAAPGWTVETPLRTLENSWNETGPIQGEVSRNEAQGERPGPLPIALFLTRRAPKGFDEQRVLVVGDGDFLSNANLASAGNRSLGMRMVEWLTAPPGSAPVPRRALPDRDLALTRRDILVVGGGSLVVVPTLLLFAGLLIRWRRGRE
ncbi:MAG: GldG family protein [Chromatiaceae bacterium]